MIAQFTLTPTESKYLIAKAIVRLDRVQNALKNGYLAIHPCTTGYCLFNEITGRRNGSKVWVTGMIVEKGFCIEANTQMKKTDAAAGAGMGKLLSDPGQYPHTMVLYKGEEIVGMTINELIEKMGPGDIYVKGVNAVDANRKVGVLLGSLAEGTIGRILSVREEKGFEILCPVGLEKFIPGTVEEAAEFIKGPKEYSTGQKMRLRPMDATVMTEVEAVESLADVKAMVFSAGGLEGAAGSISLAVRGEKEEVEKIIAVCESVKGKTLPPISEPRCIECCHPNCHLAGTRKPWVKE